MSLNRMTPTVVAWRALVAGELDPGLADGLCKILHSGSSDEAQLAFNHECTTEHGDEGGKGNEEVNLQAGHHCDKADQHSDR